MKLAVIAASGRSGRAFIEQALAAGHDITANVHRRNTLPSHPHLTVMIGDATDAAYMEQLVVGNEAVVSLIGHTRRSPKDVQTKATEALIAAMQKQGVRRVVSLTGTGVRMPGDIIPLMDRVLNLGISLVDPARIRDGIRHAEILQTSNLEWTILRVLKLQNTKPRAFTLTEHGPAKVIVSRAEVAAAILEMLERDEFVRQAPIVSRPH
ncbi:MAG TPA: NAD(P)H-binding protein [Candidatus Saccharimonadales bacterium]|nr:NAD(P)H-binding protein [Candidatus Saccharimonadales bacterium]